MTLRIHNTMTRRKETFQPIDPDHVRLYVCGPTVYDYAHIGNARPVVVFDVLVRLLRRLYPKVTYARNITDIDDKIIRRAAEEHRDIGEITAQYARIYAEDMATLGALPPDITPHATGHLPQMIAMIERLIAAGHAYAAEGHVLFNVPSMADYGRLSGRNREDMIAGARVEVAPYKRDPADFVLWKPSTPDQSGWESPWGRGRPGWHLECSAMIETHLGDTIDIHGGGQDLIFPHHENEIAQSTCAHAGRQFVKYWMHNGYVVVEGEKMSKSFGNFLTVHDLISEFPGEAIRLTLLSAHYRQPLDFTKDGMRAAKSQLDRWYRLLSDVPHEMGEVPAPILDALCDDLNTPQAIAELNALVNLAMKEEGEERAALTGGLAAALDLLGLLPQSLADWRYGAGVGETGNLSAESVESLLEERRNARKNKDFSRADEIRDELSAKGVILEDTPTGTIWRRGA
jgi:cysteinyl-tRNA synthetase